MFSAAKPRIQVSFGSLSRLQVSHSKRTIAHLFYLNKMNSGIPGFVRVDRLLAFGSWLLAVRFGRFSIRNHFHFRSCQLDREPLVQRSRFLVPTPTPPREKSARALGTPATRALTITPSRAKPKSRVLGAPILRARARFTGLRNDSFR